MSKRPKTANSFMSRLRRPAGRLRDLPIWSKLGLIMIVPTLATIVVGTNGLIDHIDSADNADRARDLAVLTETSGELVHQLQSERAAAIMLLGSSDADREKYRAAYDRTHAAVDEAKVPYSQQRASLNELPTNLTSKLTSIDQSLQDLPGTRSQVTGGKSSLTESARSYDFFVADLLDMRDLAAQLAADTTLSERMRAAAAVAQGKEFLSEERDTLLEAFSQKQQLNNALRRQFIASQTGQGQAQETFKAVANRAESELYDQTVAGADLRVSRLYDGWVDGLVGTSLQGAPFTQDEWDSALASHARLIRTVEKNLDAEVVQTATTLRDDVQQQVLIETGLLLGMLLLAILFAWLVARSMARSLRELRHGALSVAQFGLPQAVARLRDPALIGQMSPVQVANQVAEPLPVRSRDEFGQVTEAFNAVHLEAVRTAAEQAALRASVATMFVNLARRSQILVDRLIGHLDRLERGEEDPDRLAELFQLDHLATRMRRNDENLLVLAGADSTRIQREPAALIDVLRAAQSEVEHYTRIEFGIVDRDIEVAAHAVNDLVHLVAELFDNATAFSPPDSHVMVEARRVGDRAALYVEDRGIGITPEQLHDLNERLAEPPMVDVAVSRMMGLVVVARLAARHAVKVELRPAAERGTIADVTLPTSVLVPRALVGRGPQAGAFDIPVQTPAVSRSPFPAPLALESGSVPARPADPVGGRPFDPTPLNGGSMINPVGAPGRGMPAWSDLTGASPQGNGADVFTPRPPNGQRSDPLPQRRSTDPWTVEGEVTAAGPTNGVPGIPRQMPFGADGFAGPPVSVPPAVAPPTSGPPTGADAPFPSADAPFPSPDAPFPAPGTPFPGPGTPFPAQDSPFPGPNAPAGAGRPTPPAGPGRPTPPGVGQPPPPPGPSGLSGPAAVPPPSTPLPPPSAPLPPSAPMASPAAAGPPPSRDGGPVPRDGGPVPRDAGPPRREPVPSAAAPPSWPPSADNAAPPAVPENLAAALDMTAELPQVDRNRVEAGGPSNGAPAPSAPILPVPSKARFADETMELPIFRELESAWFRTRRSSPEESLTPTPSEQQFATADAGTRIRVPSSPTSQAAPAAPAPPAAPVTPVAGPTAAPPRPAAAPTGGAAPASPAPPIVPPVTPPPGPRTGGPSGRPAAPVPAAATPPPQVPLPTRPVGNGNGNGAHAPETDRWQTAADEGWRAASAAAERLDSSETTQAGLPRRVPMAQLVPGGVDKSAASVQRRTPEAVRGLLSAYHRGVQRGRSQPKDEDATGPEATPAGQQNSQAGRGPGAASGQKEQER